MMNSAAASARYGVCTSAASAAGAAPAPGALGAGAARIRVAPTYGPIVVPSELKACVSVSRLDAVRAGPRIVTYGFAATCNSVIPDASTNSAPRNST